MADPGSFANSMIDFKGRAFPEAQKEDLKLSHKHIDDVDGGYGWVICFSTSLLLFSTWGLDSCSVVSLPYSLNSVWP